MLHDQLQSHFLNAPNSWPQRPNFLAQARPQAFNQPSMVAIQGAESEQPIEPIQEPQYLIEIPNQGEQIPRPQSPQMDSESLVTIQVPSSQASRPLPHLNTSNASALTIIESEDAAQTISQQNQAKTGGQRNEEQQAPMAPSIFCADKPAGLYADKSQKCKVSESPKLPMNSTKPL